MTPSPPNRPHERPDLDALRGAVTLLVVLHHTAITYGAMGGWYLHERAPDGSLSSLLLTFFCTFNQAWFMGLFFLLAGYFTPPALARKGVPGFLVGRLLRLGLPLLVYGLLIGPLTMALAATGKGARFDEVLLRLLARGTFDIGPLWFALALLGMSLAAAAVWALGGARRRAAPWPGPASASASAWPSNARLAIAALMTGAAAWALRQAWPVGVTAWGLQLGYFASYVVLFAFGYRAWDARWLESLPPHTVRFWRRVAGLSLPVLPALYLLGASIPELRGKTLDAAYALWEPMVAWGVLLTLLQRFQHRLSQPGPAWRALSRSAFAIYVIHPPVVVGLTLAWRGVTVPAVLKLLVTGLLACALCLWIAGQLLRSRWLARVL